MVKLAPKNQLKADIACEVPCDPPRSGVEKKKFTATIKKLYGDEKRAFMESLSEKNDVDIIEGLVIEIDKAEWWAQTDSGEGHFKGKDLSDLCEALKESPIDYIVGPLAQECLYAQEKAFRRMIEAKN